MKQNITQHRKKQNIKQKKPTAQHIKQNIAQHIETKHSKI